jgi:2-oxoglutarate dehydrogenase E1 component
VERFLALASEDDSGALEGEDDATEARRATNLILCNASTPAQFFHLLRRHVISPFRKPLVVFTPKFLLHHLPCVSDLAELGPSGAFRVVLGDALERARPPKKIVVCSGKVYFHLAEERAKVGLDQDVAIVRLEQLVPFPFAALRKELFRWGPCANVVWAQEEPKNKGAWAFVAPRLRFVLGGGEVRYIGRPPGASPATGSYSRHKRELQRLIERVLLD